MIVESNSLRTILSTMNFHLLYRILGIPVSSLRSARLAFHRFFNRLARLRPHCFISLRYLPAWPGKGQSKLRFLTISTMILSPTFWSRHPRPTQFILFWVDMHGPGFVRIHCYSPSFVYLPLFSGCYFKLELDSSSLLFWLPAIFFSAPALCISVLLPVRWNRFWYRIARAPAQRSALAPQIETQGFLSKLRRT